MVEISTRTRKHGPLFNGRAARAVTGFLRDAKEEVAQELYGEVMTNLNANIQHPTPYYETQITIDPDGNDYVVHDRGIIYGPWLEGTGSRNFPVTRFKGYHSFRNAKAVVDRSARSVAERVLRRWLPRMR